jgi:hypothetical protein
VLIVVLAFYLRRYIGKIGSLSAALFLALSPGMVYISRYFIHEMFFVFLSLAIVVSVVMFIEKRRAGILAIAWTALILLVCFLPSTVKLSAALGGDNQTAVWAFSRWLLHRRGRASWSCDPDADVVERWASDLPSARIGVCVANVRDEGDCVHHDRHDDHRVLLRMDLAKNVQGWEYRIVPGNR